MNATPFNLHWALGFYLGDGNLYVRIREVVKKGVVTGIQFIPIIRMTQVNTSLNLDLAHSLTQFLSSEGVISQIDNLKPNLEVKLLGKKQCTLFAEMIKELGMPYYWKQPQITMFKKVLFILNLNVRNWAPLYHELVAAIYSIPNERKVTAEHWINQINEVFAHRAVKEVPLGTT